MSSLRGLWVVGTDGLCGRRLLLSRRFKCVERQEQRAAAQADGTPPVAGELTGSGVAYAYVPLPESDAFLLSPSALPLPPPSSPVTEAPHSTAAAADIEDLQEDPIWPLLLLQADGMWFIAVPALLEQSPTNGMRPPIASLSCIAATLALLEQMAELVRRCEQGWSRISMEVGRMLPFGRTVDCDVQRRLRLSEQGFPPRMAASLPARPAWKPYLYKGKQQVRLDVIETVTAVFHGAKGTEDAQLDRWAVRGVVTCAAAVSGLPELRISFSTTRKAPVLEQLSVAPYVVNVNKGAERTLLSVGPPIERFALMHYCLTGALQPPLFATYKVRRKSIQVLEIHASLHIAEGVPNAFSRLAITFPFPHQGRLLAAHCSPTEGKVTLDVDRSELMWTLGRKMSASKQQVSITGTVTCDPFTASPRANALSAAEIAAERAEEEAMCVKENLYMEVDFEIPDFTPSAVAFEAEVIPMPPGGKLHLTISRACVSKNFRVWNSLAVSPLAPPSLAKP